MFLFPLPMVYIFLILFVLQDQFLQNWNAQMHASSKSRNYGLFRNDINLEKYIINLNGSLFYSMIRFRTASHKLLIETVRWHYTDLSERKCELCTENDLGDEYHYLLRCTFFKKKKNAPILIHILYLFQHTQI